MFGRLAAYVRGIARRRSIDGETNAELHFHIEQEIQYHIAAGASPREARRRALRDLGGMMQTFEAVADARTAWFDRLWQDLRTVIRRFRREPGFTLTAILILTLAVGANTAILGVADAVLFRPLPYAHADEVFIVEIMNRRTGEYSTMTPYGIVDAINDLDGGISTVGMTDAGPRVAVDTADGPEVVPSISVSPEYFSILGVRPARGRIFDAQDAGREGQSAMLSYAAWTNRFARDEGIIGSPVPIGNTTFHIVGVLPRDFVFPSQFVGGAELITEMPPVARGAMGGTLHPIVRIGPGITREAAQARIDLAVRAFTATNPDWENTTAVVRDVRSVLYARAASPIMRFLLVSAVLILLIGCANLANMLLVRGNRHIRETAMQLALGASPSRLTRPILLEAIIIGLVSGGLAVLTTAWLFKLLLQQIPPIAYGPAPVGIDLRVATIAMAISLLSALLFGVTSARRAARLDVLDLLQRSAGSSGKGAWLGKPLVAVQVALSVVAVFGAVLAARTFVAVASTPLGFSSDNVIRISVSPPRPVVNQQTAQVVSVTPGVVELKAPPSQPVDRAAFYTRVMDAISAHPDVAVAGATTGLPFSNQAPYSAVSTGTEGSVEVGIEYVLPGFFETIGMRLVRGRFLTWEDFTGDREAAILSESAGRFMFPAQDPLGKVFRDRSNREFHVVGIVMDARYSISDERSDPPRAYVFPAGGGLLTPVARVRTKNEAVLAELKAAVRAAAPASPVSVEWWTDSISRNTAYRNPRFQSIVLGGLGALALILTAIGIFAIVNYLVVSRTREMGVRLAIGASPRSLIRFVLMEVITPVSFGLGVGLFAIRWISPLAEAQLFKVDTGDPVTFVLTTLVVTVAAIAGAYVPARRAAAVDPLVALRVD